MTKIQKITPFLWYDTEAEEAARFYTSIFPDSKIGAISRFGDAGPGPKGSVMVVSFTLAGQKFMALNGGPTYKLTEAISLMVNCETQAEVDRYWEKLLDGGKAQACGWLKDKYGLSWQITPTMLIKHIGDPDPAKATRVMQAMMGMVKFDINALQKAYDGT
jgi:predicted 3-demethylubiquinone-9 3-methyltransferase (glyoxalase superfamily)